MKKPKDYDSDKKIQYDDIEKFSTLIPPEITAVITGLVEVIPMTTEFIDVSPKDNTLISPKHTHVITGIAEVLHENLPDRLPLTCDIQYVIDLSQELVFPTCHTIG